MLTNVKLAISSNLHYLPNILPSWERVTTYQKVWEHSGINKPE